MVKQFTLLELHLDDARFNNAVAGSKEDAEELVAEMETDDADATTDASGRSIGRTIGMVAFAIALGVGVRRLRRRFAVSDGAVDEASDEDAVSVGIDDAVEA